MLHALRKRTVEIKKVLTGECVKKLCQEEEGRWNGDGLMRLWFSPYFARFFLFHFTDF